MTDEAMREFTQLLDVVNTSRESIATQLNAFAKTLRRLGCRTYAEVPLAVGNGRRVLCWTFARTRDPAGSLSSAWHFAIDQAYSTPPKGISLARTVDSLESTARHGSLENLRDAREALQKLPELLQALSTALSKEASVLNDIQGVLEKVYLDADIDPSLIKGRDS